MKLKFFSHTMFNFNGLHKVLSFQGNQFYVVKINLVFLDQHYQLELKH